MARAKFVWTFLLTTVRLIYCIQLILFSTVSVYFLRHRTGRTYPTKDADVFKKYACSVFLLKNIAPVFFKLQRVEIWNSGHLKSRYLQRTDHFLERICHNKKVKIEALQPLPNTAFNTVKVQWTWNLMKDVLKLLKFATSLYYDLSHARRTWL